MPSIRDSAQKAFNVASYYFDKYTRPNPVYVKEKHEYESVHIRNKALVLIQYFALFGFILNIIAGNGEVKDNIYGIIGTFSMGAAAFISFHFRLHPHVFKSIYNLYVLSFGMLLISQGQHGILGSWMAVPMFPILVYFMTGDIGHFLFHITCQTLLLNTFYQEPMKRSFLYMSIDETMQALTYYTHQNLQYSFIFTGLIHYTVTKSLSKIKAVEEKKDDFEKQKNFLLGFSHEFRNLLNSLMGNVKLAIFENPAEKIKDLLVNAEVCAELLLHLVNNILDTGKVEIGELEINLVPTRIYDTLERIWNICSELIKRKNIRGRMKIQKDIPQILLLDHYRITQIFLNLVGNSVKYTDNGYVDIGIEWISSEDIVKDKCFEPYPYDSGNEQAEGLFEKNQALSILDNNFIFVNFLHKKIDRNLLIQRHGASKGILKISVSDSGCGIVPEDLEKLFQRFTQGTIDPSKKKLGTGLGLFITKELCQRMNGDVKVFSKRGSGSTFIFCLPIEPVIDERAFFFDLAGIQRVVIQQQKLRAMVVDDEQLSQMIIKDFLGKLNVEVTHVAANGLIAYEKFRESEIQKEYINIVTMDLYMPVMDGKIAAQKIREIEAAKNLEPCLMIIISGNCSESEIKECLDKNGRIKADAFIKKPVSVDELCRIISTHFVHLYDRQRVRPLGE